MRNLERVVGRPLLRRGERPARPTTSAKQALPGLIGGMNQLTDAIRELMGDGGDLIVGCAPSAASWLTPRASRFRGENPDIRLQVRSEDRLTEYHRDDADGSLRYGDGNYPNACAELLLEEVVTPLCAPEFLKRHSVWRVSDLLKLELIDHVCRPGGFRGRPLREEWGGWLTAMGEQPGAELVKFAASDAKEAAKLAAAE